MKVFFALVLGALLLQQGALAASYDDDDDDDADNPAVTQQKQPRTPAEIYKARLELLKEQIHARREDCNVRAGNSLEFCGREIDQAELLGRHKLKVQYEKELADEAAAAGH